MQQMRSPPPGQLKNAALEVESVKAIASTRKIEMVDSMVVVIEKMIEVMVGGNCREEHSSPYRCSIVTLVVLYQRKGE